MEIGMAHTAVQNVDFHIAACDCTPLDIGGGHGRGGTSSRKCTNHDVKLRKWVRGDEFIVRMVETELTWVLAQQLHNAHFHLLACLLRPTVERQKSAKVKANDRT
jgi:hypothetical protein